VSASFHRLRLRLSEPGVMATSRRRPLSSKASEAPTPTICCMLRELIYA